MVYTFVALYIVTNILLFLSAAVGESKRHEDFQKYTTAVARGCGATINFNMAVVILLASRSALGFLHQTPLNLILPIDKAMPDLHRVVGILIMLAGILHSIMHWVTYIIKSPWSGGYSGFNSLFITGMLLFIIIVTIRVAAKSEVYHSCYEVFFRLHAGGSVLAFILLIIHGLHRGVPSSWKWVVGPLAIYILDVTMRSFRVHHSYLLVSKHSAVFQGRNIVKVRLPRVFHFQAGQYAELKVPRLSRFQWHPFTIASAPHEPEMIFYIKSVGDWTMGLYDLFKSRVHGDHPEDIAVHIRGPFGAPAQHVGQFDRVILIGGGVGATPFCSVVKDAHYWLANWTPRKKIKAREKNKKRIVAEESQTRDIKTSVMGVLNPSDGVHAHHGSLTTTARRSTMSETQESHLFTTTVFSERLESLGILDDIRKLDKAAERAGRKSRTRRHFSSQSLSAPNDGSIDRSSTGATSSMYTARDYLNPVEGGSTSTSSNHSSVENIDLAEHRLDSNPIEQIETRDFSSDEIRPVPKPEQKSTKRMFSNRFGRNTHTPPDDEGMGSYHENSTGSYRRSLEYMSALHSAYSARNQDEIFQKSLDLMVGISFGSVALVRSMQIRRAQKTMRMASAHVEDGAQLPLTIDKEDLSLFQNRRIMFLLFMRSVTINIIVLWLLFVRFIVAGTAYIFGEFNVFEEGIALYNYAALIAVDLGLSVVVAILVGTPSVIEIIELGAAPVHGFDLFVLTPVALFGVAVDIVALTGVGKSVSMFTVFHVFVLWPILTMLILVRLLRVIGERIAQAAYLTTTHSRTRKVDFFWTAPTPEDDIWLVKELERYTDMASVQMHQFLTRTERPDARDERSRRNRSPIRTNYGRPAWPDVLNEIAEKCPNNTTIGVFFCGPHSMGISVQEACMSAMRNSIVRGLHAGPKAMRGLEEVFGDAITANEYTGDLTKPEKIGARGCNVKIVFKRETFS